MSVVEGLLIIGDHLGIERGRGEGVLQLSNTVLVWPLISVGVSGCDH